MTDDLKALAEAAAKGGLGDVEALFEYAAASQPERILALIAENERLRGLKLAMDDLASVRPGEVMFECLPEEDAEKIRVVWRAYDALQEGEPA